MFILNGCKMALSSLALILVSVISYYGMGFRKISIDILIIALIVFILNRNKISSILMVLFLLVLSTYFYTGFVFGLPNIGYVASFFETNKLEAFEFISSISIKYILIYVFFYISLFSLLFMAFKRSNQTNIFITLAISIPLILFSPFFFFTDKSIDTVNNYMKNREDFKKSLNNESSWVIHEDRNEDKDIVVIIGESVRKDMMSLYGFKHDNTPYLNEVNGYFINGYVAAAPNTSPSLQRTLSRIENSVIKEEDNIVTLSNVAGFDTVWISNQGFAGKYDSPITRIAFKSKYKFFLKEGDYTSKNSDDFELLEIVQSVIGKNKNRKVLFIHMMGSHPVTCDRLQGHPMVDYNNRKDLDCYIATINKLDLFLKKTKEIMDNSKRNYSIIYFSDHGLDIDGNTQPRVNSEFKQNYEVPFFVINKNDKNHMLINRKLSAYDFLYIFESVLGVKTEKNKEYFDFENIKSNENIKVFNWTKMIDFESLKEQHANLIIR